MTSDSTLQITLTSLSSVNSDLEANKNMKLSEKMIIIFLLQAWMCVTLAFLYLLQSKHQIVTS